MSSRQGTPEKEESKNFFLVLVSIYYRPLGFLLLLAFLGVSETVEGDHGVDRVVKVKSTNFGSGLGSL